MNTRLKCLAAAAVGLFGGLAQAAQTDFTGSLSFDNSVAKIFFDVTSTVANVTLWTDSFDNGTHFDPVIELWAMSSSTSGSLMGESDDFVGAPIAGQTSADSALSFSALAPGHYLLTVVASPNFAVSGAYADGFALDAASPGALTGLAGYSVHIGAAGTGISPVPEPAPWALLLAGGAAIAWRGSKRRDNAA